ncbi:cupredoxin domain-containing protein [Candidatus Pacearchaeota archaeon]|nr:cupredoxin domain-containing protein [Candidatus Pacearchaeota archaeon]
MEKLKDSPEGIQNGADEERGKKNKKSFFRFMTVFAVILLAVVLFKFYGANAITGNAIIDSGDGKVQIAKMHVEGGNYIIEPNSFEFGVPVRIEADMSQMPGCSKSIVISAFKVRKSLTANDNIIEFTPDKAGTFNIACSMNMYKGKFTVLQSDGVKSDYAEQASTTGHTCGASGGGCGCGG